MPGNDYLNNTSFFGRQTDFLLLHSLRIIAVNTGGLGALKLCWSGGSQDKEFFVESSIK
jgi:hypothetical protein